MRSPERIGLKEFDLSVADLQRMSLSCFIIVDSLMSQTDLSSVDHILPLARNFAREMTTVSHLSKCSLCSGDLVSTFSGFVVSSGDWTAKDPILLDSLSPLLGWLIHFYFGGSLCTLSRSEYSRRQHTRFGSSFRTTLSLRDTRLCLGNSKFHTTSRPNKAIGLSEYLQLAEGTVHLIGKRRAQD